LRDGKFETAREVELKIDEYRNKNYDKLITPVAIFVTCETVESFKEFLSLNGSKNEFHLFCEKCSIERANGPTDILWENQKVNKPK
jgi:hypothetical protein